MIELFRTLIYVPFLNILMFFTWLTPGHFVAVGIIMLTIVVRILLIIPTKKQTESQRRINQMAPLIAELKKEYGEDKQGFQLAQMELYKKNKINPFGSCGFTIIQLVILIILYNAINNGLGGEASVDLYSWLPKVAEPNLHFFWTDLVKPDRFYILAILAAVLQYWQMRMLLPKEAFIKTENPDPQLEMQKRMMNIMPFVTIIFAGNFPAGVALYWVVNTLFSIVQQTFIVKNKAEVFGLEKAVEEADKKHPEFKHSESEEVKLLKMAGAPEREIAKYQAQTVEESRSKGGVKIKVRQKR